MRYLHKNHIEKKIRQETEEQEENWENTWYPLLWVLHGTCQFIPVPPTAVFLGSLKSKVVLTSEVRRTKEKVAASREEGKEKGLVEGSTRDVLPRVRLTVCNSSLSRESHGLHLACENKPCSAYRTQQLAVLNSLSASKPETALEKV